MTGARSMGLAFIVAVGGMACNPPQQTEPMQDPRHEIRFGLTFEERMAVRAELSSAKAEAKRMAEEKYPPFQSQYFADRNREYRDELTAQAEARIREKYGLSEEALEAIVDEYLRSQGVRAR